MPEQITEEQMGQLADTIVNRLGLNQVERKFTTGDNPDQKDTKWTGGDPALLQDPAGGFKDTAHFFRDIVMERGEYSHASAELQEWSKVCKTAGYMEEGDLSQGGYLIPEQFLPALIERTLEEAIVRPRAQFYPMATNRLTIPVDYDPDHSTNYFGGITIYRTGEGGTKTVTNPVFKRISLTLHKLTGMIYITDEMLEDSPISVVPMIQNKFRQAISFVEDDDFLNGDGVNKALGALNSNNQAIVTVTAEEGQEAATIVAENVIGMWSQLYPRCHAKAVWIANIECFPQLCKMSLAVGTGGIPVYIPSNGLAQAPFGTLMGRPLILTEKCQALGTAGDIALIDFSQYAIGGKSGGIRVAQSMHVRFATDEQAIRFVMRYDGQPTWLSSLTPKRGSNSLSPYVVLATRS